MEIDDTTRVTHPVSAALASISSALDHVAQTPTWSMSPTEVHDALLELARAEARLAALTLTVVHQAVTDGAGDTVGATSTSAWWAGETRQTKTACHGLVKLADRLDTPLHGPVRAAMAAGAVHLDQARVIVDAVDDLPADLVSPRVREEARDCLVEMARSYDAKDLKGFGRKILEVVAPEVAEQAEAEALDKEEQRARRGTRLTMSDDGHGLTHGRFAIPTETADRLRKALQAIAAPKHQSATTVTREGRSAQAEACVASHDESGSGLKALPLRLGEAFCEYVDRYPADKLPQAGGVPAAVTVTMSLETLLGGLGSATLDTGTAITAGRARMLACEAGIIPVVLGGDSQVLDLGRARRLFTPAQRRALELQQGGCTVQGCDWPPGMCHAHHDMPWSHGGSTDLANGRLLCPRHHARIHDPHYETTRHPDGTVGFRRHR